MDKGKDFNKMLALQSMALDILAEAMAGYGDPDEMKMRLEAVKVFNAMAKQSGFVISQDTDDIKAVMIKGIEEREAAIEAAEAEADSRLLANNPDAAEVLEMIRDGR